MSLRQFAFQHLAHLPTPLGFNPSRNNLAARPGGLQHQTGRDPPCALLEQEMLRISQEQHQIPGSLRTRVAHSTLREWLALYRAGGFDALKPRKRGDTGHPRALAAELAEHLLQRDSCGCQM